MSTIIDTLISNRFLLAPLREGRPEGLGQGFDREIFLLTPLREGRPVARVRWLNLRSISTHAPAGGATIVSAESPTLYL